MRQVGHPASSAARQLAQRRGGLTHPALSRHCCPAAAAAGGYLVFIILETLRSGKKLDERLERGVQSVGALLLLSAAFSLLIKDSLNLTGLDKFLQ